MRAAVIVELHPVADTGACVRSGLAGVQIDAFVFQGSPQPLNEDVVQKTTLAAASRLAVTRRISSSS